MTKSYLRGQDIKILTSVANEAGSPADPARLTLAVKLPDGTTSNYSLAGSTITKESTGQYFVTFTTSQAGRHFYRWESTTPGGADEGEFIVKQGDF